MIKNILENDSWNEVQKMVAKCKPYKYAEVSSNLTTVSTPTKIFQNLSSYRKAINLIPFSRTLTETAKSLLTQKKRTVIICANSFWLLLLEEMQTFILILIYINEADKCVTIFLICVYIL